MPILQTIDYQKITLSEVELQREKIVADKLKALLPQIKVQTKAVLEQLTILEKTLISFQTLAERTRSIYQ